MAGNDLLDRDSRELIVELLDAWREKQPGHPSRAEAIEHFIDLGLTPTARTWIPTE